jgi:hypothetical protein
MAGTMRKVSGLLMQYNEVPTGQWHPASMVNGHKSSLEWAHWRRCYFAAQAASQDLVSPKQIILSHTAGRSAGSPHLRV